MSEHTYFDCKAAYQRLNDYLDRELTPDEIVLVKAHLQKCRVCAMEFEFEESLLEQLRSRCCEGHAPSELKMAVKGLLKEARTKDAL